MTTEGKETPRRNDYAIRREVNGSYSVYWIRKYDMYRMASDLGSMEEAKRRADEMQAEDDMREAKAKRAAGDMTATVDTDVIFDTGDYYVKPKSGYAVWFRGRTIDWQVGEETYTDLDDALRMAYNLQKDEDMREKEGL